MLVEFVQSRLSVIAIVLIMCRGAAKPANDLVARAAPGICGKIFHDSARKPEFGYSSS